MVVDWDLYEQLLHHTYSQALYSDSQEHPVMVSEVVWNTRRHREKLAELLFEKFRVPAIYLCKDAVLTAFASGRSSALVVNAGAGGTSAVPVYDGFVINNGMRRSTLGGDFLTRKYQEYFARDKKLDVVPHYMIASKSPVEEGEPAKYVARQRPFQVHPSYHDYMVKVSTTTKKQKTKRRKKEKKKKETEEERRRRKKRKKKKKKEEEEETSKSVEEEGEKYFTKRLENHLKKRRLRNKGG